MRRRRAVVLAVVGWAVVACAGAALAWLVISRAGAGVSGGLDPVPAAGASESPGSPEPSGSPTPVDPPSDPPSSSDGPPAGAGRDVVSRTWDGAAGVVIAECRGAAVSLASATSYSGYAVEVDDEGPDRVRVEFEAEESRIRVEAECVGGEPVFQHDRSGEG